MKYKLFTLLALSGVLFSSCVKENYPAEGGSILAVMENDDTRTSVTDEGSFTWSEGDQVWLHTTSEGVVGTLSSGAGTASANFSYGSYFGEMTRRAVYPYNEGHSISGNVLSVAMPASYDLGSALTNTNAAMYGVVSDGRLKFNHMAGVMRFKFKNVPAGVNKFTITLDKKISGTFTADLTEAFPVIETSFTQKGRTSKNEVKNATKRELARVRATAMEGSFGTQKEHYGLRKIAARIKSTEILLIFFGIHTANVVNLARRESVQVTLAA